MDTDCQPEDTPAPQGEQESLRNVQDGPQGAAATPDAGSPEQVTDTSQAIPPAAGPTQQPHTCESTGPAPSLTWEESLQAVRSQYEHLEAGLLAAKQAIEQMARSQELLATKVTQLSYKLDDVTTSFSEPRIRELLTSLLLLHDLLEQMSDTADASDRAADHRRNYGVLLSQVRQVLALHGIEMIPTDIPFDESMHKAVNSIETDDLSEDGRIVRVIRKGFRSSHRPLRFADVEVKVASARARGRRAVGDTDTVEGTSAGSSTSADID